MAVVKGEACAESPGGILEVGKVHMWGSLRALGPNPPPISSRGMGALAISREGKGIFI